MVDLAHGLGLTAIAEGIETVDQLRVVRETGCDIAQGFLISQPLAPEALAEWKQAFRSEWAKLLADPPASSRSDVEADALGER